MNLSFTLLPGPALTAAAAAVVATVALGLARHLHGARPETRAGAAESVAPAAN